MTLYWGTSDGGTNAADWENSTQLGTQYAINSTPGILTFQYNGKFGSVEDLKSLNHDGSAILMGELTDPVTNGMYFNHVNDFKNSGLGIQQIASSTFPSLDWSPRLREIINSDLTNSDDNSWIWFDNQRKLQPKYGAGGDEHFRNANQEFGPNIYFG